MPRRLVLALCALLLLFGFPRPAHPCLWDRDTLSYEGERFPELIDVITGRFERNPPLFYEKRIERLTGEVAADPGRLDLYDDLGVACDRIGRADEAIGWMQKKRSRLDAMKGHPEHGDHLYRYHANVGTFWAHRWLRAGADRKQLSEVQTARRHIARAIEINPDAHFGREKYQLAALEYILKRPVSPYSKEALTLSEYLTEEGLIGDPKPGDAVKGLAGLIVLGNAWESPDVFAALAAALSDRQDGALARLAAERCGEIVSRGGRWLHLTGDPERHVERVRSRTHSTRGGEIMDQFRELRAASEDWHRRRTDYLLSRLRAGRHPDTDAAFWSGFTAPPRPSLKGSWPQEADAWVERRTGVPGTFWFVLASWAGGIVGACVFLPRLVRFVWRKRFS